MKKEKLNVKPRAFPLAIFSIVFSVNFSTPCEAAVTPANAPIVLSLNQAIQRMMENNLTVKNLQLTYERAQISYDVAWNTFYMPAITLSAGASSNYSFGDLPYTTGRNDPGMYKTRGYPSGQTLSLALGSYTLFDFFRQRATFDQAKLEFDRATSRLQEGLRTARFALISQYFQTKIAQEKLEAAERSMSISQAIAELIESRKSLGKATEDEQNSASVDLLNAQVAYGTEKKTVAQTLIQLNTTLNTTPDTEFKLTTEPPFIPVLLDEKHLFDVFKSQSPTAKDMEQAMVNSEMTVALAEKSRLPLPTLSFSGITIGYTNGFTGGTVPTYSSSTNSNGMLEVAATLSLSLPIFGPNGFFNEKAVRGAYISRDQAEIGQRNAMMTGELTIRQKIASIKQLESQIKTLRESLAKNSKILDNIFKKAASSSMDRLQLRDALKSARESELSYLDSLKEHITVKNELAEYIGLDRLPGDQL